MVLGWLADRLTGRPARPPARGGRRLRWLRALEGALAADARRTLAGMAAEGWDGADALDAYREWLTGLIATAVDGAGDGDGRPV
jgi:hypothetical protein